MGDIDVETHDGALNAEFYRPFDQDRWLPPPPWSPGLIPLVNWEKAHGHDVRLACDAGRCRTVGYEADALRSEVARLRSVVAGVEALAAKDNDEIEDAIEGVLDDAHGAAHYECCFSPQPGAARSASAIKRRLRSVLSDTKGDAQP